MIPEFNEHGNLPPGIHVGAWDEILARFGWNLRRRELAGGLASALKHLQKAGCTRICINGSLVTTKDEPGDIDVAWEPAGVDVDRLLELEPVFADFADHRAAQKAKYGCEFFQVDRQTGRPKGFVALEL